MCIIAVAIIVTIPARLHPNLVRIIDFEIQLIDRAVNPNVSSIAVRPLLENIVGVNI